MSDSRDVLGNTGQIGSFNDADRNYHPDLPKGTYFCDLRNLLPVLNSKYANLCATAKGMYEWHKRVNFCQSCGGKLYSEKAGWEKTCIKCNFKQFPRIDPVVIMLIKRGNDILLGRSHGWPEKMYSCLAGFIEPGETIEAAAERGNGRKWHKIKKCEIHNQSTMAFSCIFNDGMHWRSTK